LAVLEELNQWLDKEIREGSKKMKNQNRQKR
jgi:hypothetical protein